METQLVLLTLSLLGSYFLIMTLMQILLQALSYRRFNSYRKSKVATLPSLTLVIPAHNEAQVVVEALNRALQLPLPNYEVFVVENASTDTTFKLLQEMFQLRTNGTPESFRSVLFPQLKILRSPYPNKTQALNLALSQVKTEIIATLDADTLPDTEGLILLLEEFARRPELHALGGIVRVMGPVSDTLPTIPKSFLPATQALEYLRAFSGERLGWGLLKANIYMAGACALFRTSALNQRGGFPADTVTEDLETSLDFVKHLGSSNHPIDVLPVIVAHTQVPHNWGSLIRQRRRWQAGLWQCLWKYRSLFLNSRHGLVGTLTLPYVLLSTALGPFFEVLALATLAHALFYQMIDLQQVILIAIAGFLLAAILASSTAIVENRYLKKAEKWNVVVVFLLTFVLNLFVRPIITLVRLEATVRFPWIRSWGKIKRV